MKLPHLTIIRPSSNSVRVTVPSRMNRPANTRSVSFTTEQSIPVRTLIAHTSRRSLRIYRDAYSYVRVTLLGVAWSKRKP